VVTRGETLRLPEVETLPIPLSMEALVALVLDQLRVVLAPLLMVVELAERLPVGAGIVTVTCAVLVPPGPVSVMV